MINNRIKNEILQVVGNEVIFLENFTPKLLMETNKKALAQRVAGCNNVSYLFDLLDTVHHHIHRLMETTTFSDYKDLNSPIITALQAFSNGLIKKLNSLGEELFSDVNYLLFTAYDGLQVATDLGLDANTRYVFFNEDTPTPIIERLYTEAIYGLSKHAIDIINKQYEGNHIGFLRRIAKVELPDVCIIERSGELDKLNMLRG